MFYDSFANRSKTALGARLFQHLAAKRFALCVNSGRTIENCLEIGSGDGLFARQCREHNVAYRGIERSTTLQQRLVQAGFDVVEGRVPPVEAETGRYDLVALLAVLEHMPTFEQGAELVSECARVMKPGGLLAVEVPDFVRGGFDFFAWDHTHSFLMTPRRLVNLVTDVGLECVRIVEFTGPFVSPLARFPIDLIGFVVFSRFAYWLGHGLGLGGMLLRWHKTFEPSVLLLARKPEAPPS